MAEAEDVFFYGSLGLGASAFVAYKIKAPEPVTNALGLTALLCFAAAFAHAAAK